MKAYFSEYHSRFLSTELGLNYENFIYEHYFQPVFDEGGITPVEGGNALTSSYLGLYSKIKFDSKNRNVFATKGIEFSLDGSWKFYDLDGMSDFSYFGDVMLSFGSYIPFFGERLVISPQVYSRFLFGHGYFNAYKTLMGGVSLEGMSRISFRSGSNRPEGTCRLEYTSVYPASRSFR